MKKCAIVVMLLMVFAVFGCQKEKKNLAVPDSAELGKWIKSRSDFVLIDVRTKAEYEAGHVPTAVNIPLHIITANPEVVRKGKLVVLYCRSGARSGRALAVLKKAGHKRLINFGGLYRWKGKRVTGSSPGVL